MDDGITPSCDHVKWGVGAAVVVPAAAFPEKNRLPVCVVKSSVSTEGNI